MRNRSLAAIHSALIVAFILTLGKPPAIAQSTAAAVKATSAWTPPRTPDGKPDLQGIWTNGTLTPLERPRDLSGKEFLTEQETAERQKRLLQNLSTDRRDGGAAVDVGRSYNELWRERGPLLERTSLIVDPPDGSLPPLTPEAQKAAQARAEHQRETALAPASWEDRNLAERCITRGAPKLPGGYNNNFQIIQTHDYVAILQEMIHEVRYHPARRPPASRPKSPPLDGRFARPLGRRHVGGRHHQLQRQDRFQLVQLLPGSRLESARRGTLQAGGCRHDRLSIHRRRSDRIHPSLDRGRSDDQDAGPIFEYACHEGNYAMTDMLAGARAKEKAEAAKKK